MEGGGSDGCGFGAVMIEHDALRRHHFLHTACMACTFTHDYYLDVVNLIE